jgi:hypothetical protein
MLPPEAFTKREVFSQRGELVCKTGIGSACKTIEAVAAAVQPNAEPMTVYCVVTDCISEYVTLRRFEVLVEVIGAVHVYVPAPLALSVPTASGQTLTFATLIVGFAIKFSAIVFVAKQLFASKLLSVYT